LAGSGIPRLQVDSGCSAIRSRPRRAAVRAYSLLELIVVISLLAIVAAVGSVRYAEALSQHRARRSAEQVAADIQSARHAARGGLAGVSVSFDTVNERYTLAGVPHPHHKSGAYVVELSTGPLAAQLGTANFGGDGVLSFNTFGIPDSGGSVTIQCGSTAQTVTVVAGTGAVTIP
jgi:prepilin-type N-terminal cleavage/methylation domain-containing protein